MNKKSYSIAIVMWVLFLLISLNGCSPKSNRYKNKSATFLDGIWHGIISPIYGNAKPKQLTPLYNSGFKLGEVWTTIWSWLGFFIFAIILPSLINNTKDDDGCLIAIIQLIGIPLGLLIGMLIGILIGSIIYWPVYSLDYLIGSVNIWIRWVLGTH